MSFHELKSLFAQNARLDGAHHATALTHAGAALNASWADAGRAGFERHTLARTVKRG